GAARHVADSFAGYPIGIREGQLPEPGIRSYVLTLCGRSDLVTACACERSGEVTLPQLLHLNNGDEIDKKLHDNEGRLSQLLKNCREDMKLTDLLFMATLGRHQN